MQRDEIGFRARFGGSGQHRHEGNFGFCRLGEIGVVTHYVHTERVCGDGNFSAYRAESEHGERFAEDFVSDELLFAFLHLFRNVVARERGRPRNGFGDVTRGKYEFANDHFLHGIGVCAGRVEDDDTARRVIGVRNVVDARTRSGHREKRGGNGVFGHIRASHENTHGSVARVGEVVAFENFVRQGGDCVEFENIHIFLA